MHPWGGTRTRFLAAVAAFMTVTAGLPRVQCVCPDGRVKPFCPGPSASGCCCASSSARTATQVKACCCRGAGETPPCCTLASATRPAGEEQARAVKTCGCVRTVVADAVVYTAEDVGCISRLKADELVSWEVTPATSEHATRLARVEPRYLLHPPDLVVALCHFTC
jgi:hypothetical protein